MDNKRQVQGKPYKIKISTEGKENVWFNTRLGQHFLAYRSPHPEDNSVMGFMINGLLFVPDTCCKVLEAPRKSQFQGRPISVPIQVYNIQTEESIYFDSIKAGCNALNVNKCSLYASIRYGYIVDKKYKITRHSNNI